MIYIRKIQEVDYVLALELLKENMNMPRYNYTEKWKIVFNIG